MHLALADGTPGGPSIVSSAYRGRTVGMLLEYRAGLFVIDQNRNRFDDDKKIARLSDLFQRNLADFGGEKGLAAFVGRYRGRTTEGYRIQWMPFEKPPGGGST